MRRTSPGDAPTHVAASPAPRAWLRPRSTSCDSSLLRSNSLPAPPLRTCCRCFSSRCRDGCHGYHPSASTIQAHHPRELRLTVLRMGDQKPFMMMAPMFLPHCPGDEDQPLPDIPAPCPYLTSQHPDRQLNGPPPIAPDGSKRSGSGQARRCTHHRPTDGSPTRGETLQCVRKCWHDKIVTCPRTCPPECLTSRLPGAFVHCLAAVVRSGTRQTSPTHSK